MLLEEGFGSKMQAEMLVLVDVLHKPAAIFPSSSAFRLKAQDRRFIAKYILLFFLNTTLINLLYLQKQFDHILTISIILNLTKNHHS